MNLYERFVNIFKKNGVELGGGESNQDILNNGDYFFVEAVTHEKNPSDVDDIDFRTVGNFENFEKRRNEYGLEPTFHFVQKYPAFGDLYDTEVINTKFKTDDDPFDYYVTLHNEDEDFQFDAIKLNDNLQKASSSDDSLRFLIVNFNKNNMQTAYELFPSVFLVETDEYEEILG